MRNSASARPDTTGYFASVKSVPTGFARAHEKGRRFSGASDSGSTKTPYSALAIESSAAATKGVRMPSR